jgi:hypothetical protein
VKAFALSAGLLLAGCAASAGRPDQGAAAQAGPAGCDPARDRAAILSMAGVYDVQFSFAETVALAPGYQPRPAYRAQASELVVVVESGEHKIVLQHILAVNDAGDREAIKHWRQDWTYEDRVLLEYRGPDQPQDARSDRWQKASLSAEQARCSWTQAVFEINDGPRYEGWGRFVHGPGASTWASNETWRPLPRRERARKDYEVIVGVNRHTITAGGWAHEQDNTKLALRGGPRGLVREHGVNVYSRRPDEDLPLARAFWSQHEAFWRDVRAAWARVIDARSSLSLRRGTSASALYDELVGVRGVTAAGDRVARAEQVLLRHLEAPLAGR